VKIHHLLHSVAGLLVATGLTASAQITITVGVPGAANDVTKASSWTSNNIVYDGTNGGSAMHWENVLTNTVPGNQLGREEMCRAYWSGNQTARFRFSGRPGGTRSFATRKGRRAKTCSDLPVLGCSVNGGRLYLECVKRRFVLLMVGVWSIGLFSAAGYSPPAEERSGLHCPRCTGKIGTP
jgi:hypothetical protein